MDKGRRDAYVLAVAPAMVFLGVYAYERGRYHFLRVAPDFIDLSLNRLLAGGAVVGALSVTLVGLTVWMWNYSSSRGRKARWIAAFLAALVFVGLPTALWLERFPRVLVDTEVPSDLDKILSILAAAIAGASTVVAVEVARRAADYTRKAVSQLGVKTARPQGRVHRGKHAGRATSDGIRAGEVGAPGAENAKGLAEQGRLPALVPWTLLKGIALLLWTAWVFAGLGYRIERSYTSRLCVADRFVADVHGDNLLLKSFDRTTGEILSPIKVMEAKDAELDGCSLKLIGARGFTLWDAGSE